MKKIAVVIAQLKKEIRNLNLERINNQKIAKNLLKGLKSQRSLNSRRVLKKTAKRHLQEKK